MNQDTPRIPSLDGLRAVSITLVLVSHFINCLGYNDPLFLGNLGVRVFFVISGFLITGLLLRELETQGEINLTRFYIRRTLRIFPPYYFFLAVMFCLTLFQLAVIPARAFLPAVSYTSDYISTGAWPLAHSWSLSVEEQFYLLFPGLLVLLGKRRSFFLLCLVVVASPIIRVCCYHVFKTSEPFWLVDGFHSNMDALAVGCLLAFMRPFLHRGHTYSSLLSSRLIWLIPPVLVIANLQEQHPHLYYGFCISILNLLIALMIDWAVSHPHNSVGRLLNSRPLVAIGLLSYSIYLWQQPFLDLNSSLSVVRNPLNLIVLCAVIAFSYFVVERYSLRFRRRAETRLRVKRPLPLAPEVCVVESGSEVA
jgi:peptidoglycan/LPS O-acetylase OafA/YrhL